MTRAAAFLAALESEDIRSLERLLAAGYWDENCRLLLPWAVVRGSPRLCELLLDGGADLDMNLGFGSALDQFVQWAEVGWTRRLLRRGAKPTAETVRLAREPDILQLLLAAGAPATAQALAEALERNDLRVASLLLEAGADPHHEDADGCSGWDRAGDEARSYLARLGEGARDLVRLAGQGDLDGVKAALEKGADPDQRERKPGWSPRLARRWAHHDLDLDAGFFHRTALARACEHGHLEVAQALVAAGADPEATDCLGLSPVALAARSGHRVVVEYLRTLGASLGSGRLSVLSMAAARGQDLDWLLQLVWDQASLDHALAQSCRRRCLQSVRRLLAQGARANADLGEHDGPLACAVLGLDEDYSEPVELIELLLEHGADPEQQCQEGPLPELAFRYGFRTLAK